MSWPFLFTNAKHNINNLNTSSNSIGTSTDNGTKEEENTEEYSWHELELEVNNSLLTSLRRICTHWHQIVFNKIRFILTLIFFSILKIATQLPCFHRRRALVRSTSPLSCVVTSSSIETLEEDLNHSSTSLIKFNSQLDLLSLENSTMAHMLVQQQTHRTPNISIHQTTSTQNDNLLQMSHSVDDATFYYKQDSASFFQFLQRFASEPQMSLYHPTSNTSSVKNSTNSPISNTFLPIDEPEANDFDCDKFEPVIAEIATSDQSNDLSPSPINDTLEEDVTINTNSSLLPDRHFRRRKQRSSLTRISSSSDETELISTEKIDKNNNNQDEKSQEISENVQPISTESLSLNENNEKKDDNVVENDESNDQITPSSRLRGRRLRYRLHRHTPSTSEESTSDNTPELLVPTETPISTPPSSPTSPTVNVPSSNINANTLTSNLKPNGSVRTTKKMVRFADTVGRELAQVQYIQSLIDDDDDLKGFSSAKNKLYVPNTFNFEHKPWSFDVALTSKQIPDARIPRRFFCLYRQPYSEHPDVYLHEIWRSQIKLEHADIRLKSSLTGEQYLYGTLWVTNASYWKNVTIKYSFNRWLNTYEYEAQHRCHSNDFRNIDQFEFSIDIPHDIDRIDFVLRYCFNGQEHWDNNEGKNYTIETESASTPQTIISLPHDCDFNEMRFY